MRRKIGCRFLQLDPFLREWLVIVSFGFVCRLSVRCSTDGADENWHTSRVGTLNELSTNRHGVRIRPSEEENERERMMPEEPGEWQWDCGAVAVLFLCRRMCQC